MLSSRVSVFIASKTHRSIRVYTTVLMRFLLSLELNSVGMLQTHAPSIFSVIVFILMRFRPFSTVHIKTIYVRFRFDPLSRAFSNRCFSWKRLGNQCGRKAKTHQCGRGLSADNRKRIKTRVRTRIDGSVFGGIEKAYFWKRISVDRALITAMASVIWT